MRVSRRAWRLPGSMRGLPGAPPACRRRRKRKRPHRDWNPGCVWTWARQWPFRPRKSQRRLHSMARFRWGLRAVGAWNRRVRVRAVAPAARARGPPRPGLRRASRRDRRRHSVRHVSRRMIRRSRSAAAPECVAGRDRLGALHRPRSHLGPASRRPPARRRDVSRGSAPRHRCRCRQSRVRRPRWQS